MEFDWRLAGNSNPFGEFAQGYQNGQETKFQRERVEAYKADLDARKQEAERASQLQEETARLGQFTQVLKNLASSVPEGERVAALRNAVPMLARLGLDPNELSTTTEDELSNESLSLLIGNIEKAAEEYTLAPGAKRYRGSEVIADNPAAPERPISVPQGTTLLDPETRKPIYTAPKTYAPPRASGGGRGGAAKPSGPRPTGRMF